MSKKLILSALSSLNIDANEVSRKIKKIKNLNINTNSSKNKKIISDFNKLYYKLGEIGESWNNTFWMGVRTWKYPTDLWVYQEIIFEVRPDIIIETGTAFGGSALFLASVLDNIGKGKVITVDIQKQEYKKHKRIIYLNGSSTSEAILNKIRKLVSKKDKVLVILDSDHRMPHVLDELNEYSDLVSKDSYLIVEDTSVNGHPVYQNHGPGPFEALEIFMNETKIKKSFLIDKDREKFMLTMNPRGFLKKIA